MVCCGRQPIRAPADDFLDALRAAVANPGTGVPRAPAASAAAAGVRSAGAKAATAPTTKTQAATTAAADDDDDTAAPSSATAGTETGADVATSHSGDSSPSPDASSSCSPAPQHTSTSTPLPPWLPGSNKHAMPRNISRREPREELTVTEIVDDVDGVDDVAQQALAEPSRPVAVAPDTVLPAVATDPVHDITAEERAALHDSLRVEASQEPEATSGAGTGAGAGAAGVVGATAFSTSTDTRSAPTAPAPAVGAALAQSTPPSSRTSNLPIAAAGRTVGALSNTTRHPTVPSRTKPRKDAQLPSKGLLECVVVPPGRVVARDCVCGVGVGVGVSAPSWRVSARAVTVSWSGLHSHIPEQSYDSFLASFPELAANPQVRCVPCVEQWLLYWLLYPHSAPVPVFFFFFFLLLACVDALPCPAHARFAGGPRGTARGSSCTNCCFGHHKRCHPIASAES